MPQFGDLGSVGSGFHASGRYVLAIVPAFFGIAFVVTFLAFVWYFDVTTAHKRDRFRLGT